MLKEICDVGSYKKSIERCGVDLKAMSFSGIERKNLYAAREVLEKLHEVLKKLETQNPRPYGDQ